MSTEVVTTSQCEHSGIHHRTSAAIFSRSNQDEKNGLFLRFLHKGNHFVYQSVNIGAPDFPAQNIEESVD